MGVTVKNMPKAPGKTAQTVGEVIAKVQSIAAEKPEKPAPKKSELAALIAQIKKDKGDKVVFRGRDIPDVERLQTGDFEFDFSTGGGFPKGRFAIIYGPESSCLSGGAFIQYEIRTPDGKRQNHKGGTLENLYLRFNGLPRKGKGFYQRPSTVGSEFFCPSVNEEGRIIQNRIVAVVKTGDKPVYRVTTQGGLQLIATADHRFLSEGGYVRLEHLSAGSKVMVHNNTPYRVDSPASKASRPAVHVKYHPHGTHHVVNGCAYKSVIKSRLAYEARLNNLGFEEFITRLNIGDLTRLEFLPPEQHVHHRDENFLNNDEKNLVVLHESVHGRLHAWERHNNLRYTAVEDHILSIESIGVETVYDIEMEDPYPNFVADGFVVHNCKTTMALRAAAVAQRGPEECNKVVFVDCEHSFDAERAEELGVDVDALIVIKPGYGEEAADIFVGMVAAEDVALVILDSLAAMISSVEADKSAEKFDVGTSAILIKRMCNKANLALMQEAKRDHYPAVILINQIRYKVGVMFGNPETTPGGKTPHFLSALTIRVSGKNKVVGAVNPDKPAFKELTFDIVKAKVGIIRSHFEMDLAMIAHGDLLAGESASWNLVKGELQAAGLLASLGPGKGYSLDGKTYPKLGIIEDTYYAEMDFALHLQKMVINTYANKKVIVDNSKQFLAQDGDHPEEPANMMFAGEKSE